MKPFSRGRNVNAQMDQGKRASSQKGTASSLPWSLLSVSATGSESVLKQSDVVAASPMHVTGACSGAVLAAASGWFDICKRGCISRYTAANSAAATTQVGATHPVMICCTDSLEGGCGVLALGPNEPRSGWTAGRSLSISVHRPGHLSASKSPYPSSSIIPSPSVRHSQSCLSSCIMVPSS